MASRSYAPRHSAVPTRTTLSGRQGIAVAGTVGAAAVAAAALAGPAAAAGIPQGVWDRVASCESSNDWHIDTGNGYYGGLQFSSGTWQSFGGHRYANEASGASRAEQIEVARRVLAGEGPDAWPVCGPRAGLTRSSGDATTAALPAVAGSERLASADHKQAHRKAHHKAHRKAHHTAHRKAHHASHHGTRHKSRSHATRTYRVQAGDTLSSIARTHHVAGGWRTLFQLNRGHLQNPDVLHVHQLLRLP